MTIRVTRNTTAGKSENAVIENYGKMQFNPGTWMEHFLRPEIIPRRCAAALQTFLSCFCGITEYRTSAARRPCGRQCG
jgi:hypothetical protein